MSNLADSRYLTLYTIRQHCLDIDTGGNEEIATLVANIETATRLIEREIDKVRQSQPCPAGKG